MHFEEYIVSDAVGLKLVSLHTCFSDRAMMLLRQRIAGWTTHSRGLRGKTCDWLEKIYSTGNLNH